MQEVLFSRKTKARHLLGNQGSAKYAGSWHAEQPACAEAFCIKSQNINLYDFGTVKLVNKYGKTPLAVPYKVTNCKALVIHRLLPACTVHVTQ